MIALSVFNVLLRLNGRFIEEFGENRVVLGYIQAGLRQAAQGSQQRPAATRQFCRGTF